MNLFRSTTTLATDPKNRSPFRHALHLIPLVLACFGLLPIAKGTPDPATVNNMTNTADGSDALFRNNSVGSTGTNNTAVGFDALFGNTTGNFNTAVGAEALHLNITGSNNTAAGFQALFRNTSGRFNTANGVNALLTNSTGIQNTANGVNGLFHNTTGNFNTANGNSALLSNTTGSSNVGIGVNAGRNLTTGSGNVCIGVNVLGIAGESNTTRIRNVYPSAVSGLAVYVDSAGKLGHLSSSQRYKEEIKPMDEASEAILALKPVTFHYKKKIDTNGAKQFGLVAEEVEKVNPDLVTRDGEGKPETVRYEAVNTMLLNEFLKEHRRMEEQDKRIEELTAQLKQQAALIQNVRAQVEMTKPTPQVVSNQ
jgi:hypothetical protein